MKISYEYRQEVKLEFDEKGSIVKATKEELIRKDNIIELPFPIRKYTPTLNLIKQVMNVGCRTIPFSEIKTILELIDNPNVTHTIKVYKGNKRPFTANIIAETEGWYILANNKAVKKDQIVNKIISNKELIKKLKLVNSGTHITHYHGYYINLPIITLKRIYSIIQHLTQE